MKKRYLIAFLLVTFTGLLFIACDISKINGKDFEETSDDEEIEDLACTVQGINALEGYIEKWENCKNVSTGEWQHRVMLRELGGDLLVQVSDEENSGYSPLIWINGGHLMVMYAENNSDHQEVILYATLINLKEFTINGELVSKKILLKVDLVPFVNFQIQFARLERDPTS